MPSDAALGVSCTTTACIAVGDYRFNNYVTAGLAEARNGAEWVAQFVPSPKNTDGNQLFSVSCPSASSCVAVGQSDTTTLAESWDGRRWTVDTPPSSGPPATSELTSVSCPAVGACTAVGYNTDSTTGATYAIAEEWNGSNWTVEPTPQSPFESNFSLAGVSCTSVSDCEAVGTVTNVNGTLVTLAEVWNGTTWTLQQTPDPTGAQASRLSSVSCTSSSSCTAVGRWVNSSGTLVTLAEALRGSTWHVVPTPVLAGAIASALFAVSCPESNACMATGTSADSVGNDLTLAEVWNGTKWTLLTTPRPATAVDSYLPAVSCVSSTACTAVGAYTTSANAQFTLAETWNGITWTIAPTRNPAGIPQALLGGISCTSSTACTTVGGYVDNAGTDLTLSESWDGTKWAVVPSPEPTSATSSQLYDVSCASSSFCAGVGEYWDTAGAQLTLAELWNGTRWRVKVTPNPPSGQGTLTDVSCFSATACMATGVYSVGSGLTMSEFWNGTSWRIQPIPRPSGTSGDTMYSVSCPSASACTAVGTYESAAHGWGSLVEFWNGVSWKIEPTPNPPQATYVVLSAVSCPTSASCIAVGDYSNAKGVTLSFAEFWNGTTWTWEPTGLRGALSSLSCFTASACMAIGGSYSPHTGAQFATAVWWNGENWSYEPPAHAPGADLQGVACTSADSCIATGLTENTVGATVTLAEGWNGTGWTVQSPAPLSGASSGE